MARPATTILLAERVSGPDRSAHWALRRLWLAMSTPVSPPNLTEEQARQIHREQSQRSGALLRQSGDRPAGWPHCGTKCAYRSVGPVRQRWPEYHHHLGQCPRCQFVHDLARQFL